MQITAIPRGNCWNCCPVNLKQDVRFLFYSKEKPNQPTIINPTLIPGTLRAAGVDPDLRTTIYIHGFSELSPGQSGEAIKNGEVLYNLFGSLHTCLFVLLLFLDRLYTLGTSSPCLRLSDLSDVERELSLGSKGLPEF